MRAAQAAKGDTELSKYGRSRGSNIFFGVGEADSLRAPVPPDASLKNSQPARPGASTFKLTQVNPTFEGFMNARELHKIQQRRYLEATRKKRILDAKVRTIGVDRQALGEQLEEKRRMKDLEDKAGCWWDLQMLKQDKHAQELDRQSTLLRRQREIDLVKYRETFQKKAASAEWDLNDPNAKKNAIPERVGDKDPRCGAASLLKFEGEDLPCEARRKQQQQQIMQWHKDQLDEKALQSWLQSSEDQKRAEREEEAYRRIFEIEALQAESRRQATVANAEFNKAYAKQKREAAARARHVEQAQNQHEIKQAVNSAILCERDEVQLGGKRAKHKGLTDEEVRAIFNEQAHQRDALRARRIEEAENVRISATRSQQEQIMSQALEKQLYDERRHQEKQLVLDNRKLEAQRRVTATRRGRLYAPEIGEQYFGSFDAIAC